MVIPPGYVGLRVDGRYGEAWVGDHLVAPDLLALLLAELGLGGQPVFLVMDGGGQGGTRSYATRLSGVALQPVRATRHSAWVSDVDGVVNAFVWKPGANGAPGDWEPAAFTEFLPFDAGAHAAPATRNQVRAAAQVVQRHSDGRPAVIRIRRPGESTNLLDSQALRWLLVRPGDVAIDMHGAGGQAFLGEQPVATEDLDAVLAELGVTSA
jgi:hypothetical protein